MSLTRTIILAGRRVCMNGERLPLPLLLPSQQVHFPQLTYQRLCTASPLADHSHFRRHINKLLKEYDTLEANSVHQSLSTSERKRLLSLTDTAKLTKELNTADANLKELTAAVKTEEDAVLKDLMDEERRELVNTKQHLFEALVTSLVPVETDDITDILLEVHAGVGGLEAGLFAYSLFEMYQRFAAFHGWTFIPGDMQLMEGVAGSQRSINKIQVEVSGSDVFRLLKFESGIHRVQRVPSTEKSGRVHTSTAVVVIIPKPAHIDINIQQKDLKIDVFRSQGGGGQSVNTTESAVRITHLPTGTVVECQQERSQLQNKAKALNHLKSRLYEKQLYEQQAKTRNMRRLQIGGANRNEKIRTYNYQQDRITDHRVKLTINGINGLLEGKEVTENFLQTLMSMDRQERFKQWLSELDSSEDETPPT